MNVILFKVKRNFENKLQVFSFNNLLFVMINGTKISIVKKGMYAAIFKCENLLSLYGEGK